MSESIEAKKQIVEEIKAKIQASSSVVFASYNKLTVAEVSGLRRQFTEANCEYKVYKNTLVRKAMNELGVTDFDADLNGTTATVFCADQTSAARILAKAVQDNKDFETKLVPKSAYVDKTYVDKKGVAELASIPSREILIARMLGSMQSTVANFARVINAIAEKNAQ